MYKYSHDVDNHPGDAWASTFTVDGSLEYPGMQVKGRDKLAVYGARPTAKA